MRAAYVGGTTSAEQTTSEHNGKTGLHESVKGMEMRERGGQTGLCDESQIISLCDLCVGTNRCMWA